MLKLLTIIAIVGITINTFESCGEHPVTAQAATTPTTAMVKPTTKVQEAASRSNDRATSLGTAL